MQLRPYFGKMWQCSECGLTTFFNPFLVSLEGGGMRIVLTCKACGQASVVKAKGLFRPRFETEASLPLELRQFPEMPPEWSQCELCEKPASPVIALQNMFLSGIREAADFHRQYGVVCLMHSTFQTKTIMRDLNLRDYDASLAERKACKSCELGVIEIANRVLGLGIDESIEPRA